jgi:hypothetical protein
MISLFHLPFGWYNLTTSKLHHRGFKLQSKSYDMTP